MMSTLSQSLLRFSLPVFLRESAKGVSREVQLIQGLNCPTASRSLSALDILHQLMLRHQFHSQRVRVRTDGMVFTSNNCIGSFVFQIPHVCLHGTFHYFFGISYR